MSQHIRVLLDCLLILVACHNTSLCAVSFQLLVLPPADNHFLIMGIWVALGGWSG